jgi:hypothetical protein
MTMTNGAPEPVNDADVTSQPENAPPFEGPASTAASLLELLKDGPFWDGDDLEECLAIVYATRSVWYP